MISKVHIETEHRNGRTIIRDLFYAPPFRIADISGKRPVHLRMMQMSSSPGILEGDSFHFTIRLKENSVASLETQAYQRLYRMKEGAGQFTDIHLDKNSFFEFLPHPTVPHAGASFTSNTNISMEESSRLIFGEIYTCGRILCEESFKFNKVNASVSIKMENRLILKEKLVIEANDSLPKIGMMESYTHQGSMFIIDRKIPANEFIESVRQQFLLEHSAITRIDDCGFAIRVLGHKAEPIFELFKSVSQHYKKTTDHGS